MIEVDLRMIPPIEMLHHNEERGWGTHRVSNPYNGQEYIVIMSTYEVPVDTMEFEEAMNKIAKSMTDIDGIMVAPWCSALSMAGVIIFERSGSPHAEVPR